MTVCGRRHLAVTSLKTQEPEKTFLNQIRAYINPFQAINCYLFNEVVNFKPWKLSICSVSAEQTKKTDKFFLDIVVILRYKAKQKL